MREANLHPARPAAKPPRLDPISATGLFRRASRAERILRDHGYNVAEKIGDDQLDWLFRPPG